MDNIGFSGFPLLVLMGVPGNLVRLFDHRQIVGGVIFPDAFYQVVVKHLRTRKIRRSLQLDFNIFQLISFHAHPTFFPFLRESNDMIPL